MPWNDSKLLVCPTGLNWRTSLTRFLSDIRSAMSWYSGVSIKSKAMSVDETVTIICKCLVSPEVMPATYFFVNIFSFSPLSSACHANILGSVHYHACVY